MRVLLYNFVQPEEPGAGGVGVYLNNLAKALARDHEVITLSSGDRYSPGNRASRVDFSHDQYDRAVIVNSPVLAPAAYSFADPVSYLSNADLDFVPDLLAERYGSIDVFHFQNIEGLSRSFFIRLRTVFPHARVLYSAHNYHPLCSRVSLWYQNRAVCVDYRDGVACTECRAPTFNVDYIRNKRRLTWTEKAHPRLMAVASPLLSLAKLARRLIIRARQGGPPANDPTDESWASDPSALPPAATYAAYRQANIELARDVFDHVLAVSERTREVLVRRGMPDAKVKVSYIGTAYKQTYLDSTKIKDIGSDLHLGYIGYMGTDKGFTFMLECLEQVPDELARTITITVAARNTFPQLLVRLRKVGGRFRALRYFDGYTHATLDHVLDGVNLGLIPVLWEDNLPQTAIELVSRGIPILTSDRGGAQEIAHNPQFIFRAGDHADFVDHLRRISDRELSLEAFWAGDMRILSMAEHVDDLMRYYRSQPALS